MAVGHFVQDFDRELVMLLLIVMMVLIIDDISNYFFEPVKKKQIPHLHLQNDNMEEIEN